MQPEHFGHKWLLGRKKTPPKVTELCFLTCPLSHRRYFRDGAELSCGAEACHMEILTLEKGFARLFDDDDNSGGGTHVTAYGTSACLMKDTHCSHKPSVGL